MQRARRGPNRREFVAGLGVGGLLATTGGTATVAGERTATVPDGSYQRVEAVVRFEPADLDGVDGEAATVGTLQRHAEATRTAFRRFVERTDGIEVATELWLANAALVTLAPDAVVPGALLAVEGVTGVHRNEQEARGDLGMAVDAAAEHAGSASRPAVESGRPKPAGPTPGPGRRQTETEFAHGVESIHAPDVWEFFDTRGEGAAVAVLDSGVDPTGHDGIAGALDRGGWAEFDTTGGRVDSEPHDPEGHGTGMSGLVVGGRTDDGLQYGVAPEADLYHAKVAGEDGLSFVGIVAALEWAVEQGVDVISLSLGPMGYVGSFVEPVANARESGALVVGSIGNVGRHASACPGNLPTSVGVGAVDRDGSVPDYSGGERIRTERYWGQAAPDHWPDEYVVPDVTAPGESLPTAAGGGGYRETSATSGATPHVAGAAALAVAAADDPGPDALERALVERAQHPAVEEPLELDPGADDRYGHGVVSAFLATAALLADESVRGVVRGPSGNPLPGATVVAESGDRTTTDADGEFELSLPPGPQPVGATALGFEFDAVEVDPSETDEVGFSPPPSDGVEAQLSEQAGRRIDPGGEARWTFAIANVEAVTVDVATTALLQRSDLELLVDGEPAELQDPVAVDATERRPSFEVVLRSGPDARVGTFVPYVSFHGGDGGIDGELARVHHHPDPLPTDPAEIPDLRPPLDVAAPGTTLELVDGVYEQPVEDEGGGLVLDEPVTLRAAEGAAPEIAVDGADGETAGVYVGANDVELRGVDVRAEGADAAIRVGSRGEDVPDGPSGVTISGATVWGARRGVVSGPAPALVVEESDLTAREAGIAEENLQRTVLAGNEVHDVEDGIVLAGRVLECAGNHVHDVESAGIRVTSPDEVVERFVAGTGPIRENEIERAEDGVVVDGATNDPIEDNRFREIESRAIHVVGSATGPIRGNVVERAVVGVEVAGDASVGEVTGNEFRDVETPTVGVDGGAAAGADSVLGAALYAATGLSIGALLVPYARRRLRS